MPALPAVPKGVRVDFHFAGGTDPNYQIRELFQYAGTLSSTDAATWCTNIRTAMGVFVAGVMTSSIALVMTELTDLTSSTAPQIQDTTVVPGTNGATPVPAGVAMVLKKHISRRYRGGHPRVYLPGMVTTFLNGPSFWDPTHQASVVSAYNTFLAACVANTNPAAIGAISHVNISYFLGFTNHLYPSGRYKSIPTPRATPVVDAIISVTGNPVPGSQRRRNEQP